MSQKKDRILRKVNKENGSGKILAFIFAIMAFFLVALFIVYFIQLDTIATQDEKIKTMKTDMGAMAIQAAADQVKIAKYQRKIKDIREKWLDSIFVMETKLKNLKFHLDRYKECATGLIEACKLIMNWCTDIDIPKLRACLKIFAKIIDDTKKYHIPKAEVGK